MCVWVPTDNVVCFSQRYIRTQNLFAEPDALRELINFNALPTLWQLTAGAALLTSDYGLLVVHKQLVR